MAASSSDSELVGTWLLSELLEPGGKAKRAKQARARLDHIGGHGLSSDLARGLDDQLHGRLTTASDHYLSAAKAAREGGGQDADLLAHFAVRRAVSLRNNTQELWDRWSTWVEQAIKAPKHLGWRARDELVQWWAQEAWAAAAKDVEEGAAERLGCLRHIRLAGPFGIGAAADSMRSFEAEGLAPWPARFTPDRHFGRAPHLLETERTGCTVDATSSAGDGIFYAETVVHAKKPLDAILLVQAAVKVWVDDREVFSRDLREWGSWTNVAASVHLPEGRHRILARLTTSATAIRLMQRNGLPLKIESSVAAGEITGVAPGKAGPNPAPLRRYVSAQGVGDPPSVWVRYVAADLAQADGEDEVGSMLMDPLIEDMDAATGPALSTAAAFVEGDPIFNTNQTEDLMRELHQRALERDPELWLSALAGVAQVAKSRGITEAVAGFKELTERYREVPPLLGALANVYGELGWTPEYRATVKLRAERFPEDTDGLYTAAQVLIEEGRREEAEELYERIRRLDPDSEVFIGLALEREDYDAALEELERLRTRRPKRKDLLRSAERIRLSAGRVESPLRLLEAHIEREPQNTGARMAWADALYANGDPKALHSAVVDAVQAGGNPAQIKAAIDLVEGLTELEPYRLRATDIIAQYEKSGRHMEGTAARILDYMAAWVQADGSSRILEHEVIRIQSEEAIGRFAEHRVRGDIVLQMRVIKQDGHILEPELVAGKPTVTFPHLELGDYIETEQIFVQGGSPNGTFYDGPHWFFREKAVAYARSEFVLIAPAHKQLNVETTGSVPSPTVDDRGYFKVHRWRVDFSPPAPNEPLSAPISEYLPSVRVSWGLDLPRRLRLLSNQVVEMTPVDPRIVRIAEKIVEPIPRNQKKRRAKSLYHWVLENVQEGEEADGRRVVTGKRGNAWRAFSVLCRALDIEVNWAIAKNRLAPPAKGPQMESQQFNTTVLRIGGKDGTFLTFDGKFVPFGYIPAQVRGMPAYVLRSSGPEKVTLPSGGTLDGVRFRIDAILAPNGSAELRITQRYEGQFATSLRQALDQLPERRLHDVLEEQLLANAFPGARLLSYELQQLTDSDAPLIIVMEGEMSHFARVDGKSLRVPPPYSPRLSQLATLPTRQTPILISAERRQEVELNIKLPSGASARVPKPAKLAFRDFSVDVADTQDGTLLHMKRKIVIPATRVAPDAYAEFVQFTRDADSVLAQDVVIRL